MPRAGIDKELSADRVIADEERANRRQVRKLGQREQHQAGYDFESIGPDGDVVLIEVKGWGEPLVDPVTGTFGFHADLRAAQVAAARTHGRRWRLEIVGNIDAALRGDGAMQRLTLFGDELADDRLAPRIYDLALHGLEQRVRTTGSAPGPPPMRAEPA